MEPIYVKLHFEALRILGPNFIPIRGSRPNMELIYVKLHFERSCTPTLQMAKTCLKRRLFDNKNDVYWMGVGSGLNLGAI